MRIVVVGSGLAGLLTAIELAAYDGGAHQVLLLTKAELGQSNTRYAQGGVAVVGPRPDSVEAHVADTLRAGAGLSDHAAATVLASDGPQAIDALLGLGVRFDRADGALCRALEAAHSHPRVLRAGGDATGDEIVRALVVAALERGIQVREHTTVVNLMVGQDRCRGLEVLTERGDVELIEADAVVLATGGAGQLYPVTSNPVEATGDGVGLALRAGAQIADPEMVQFHPTVLAPSENHPAFLVSEAVRGEGAVLRDASGDRFMVPVHPDAELAPRDVVARAIARQHSTQGSPVMLDATAIGAEVTRRFPTIAAACRDRGLDLARRPVPVTPAAHYWMGGVRTDSYGRTSLPGLWAVGEVACTGVHGANRLASNSLLEAAVFARRAAVALTAGTAQEAEPAGPTWPGAVELDLADAPHAREWERAELQAVMWQDVGLHRTRAGLERARETLASFRTPCLLPDAMVGLQVRDVEDANLLLAARAVVAGALARTSSLGAHHRSDADGSAHAQPVHQVFVRPRPAPAAPARSAALAGVR